LTFCVNRRRRVFADAALVDAMLAQISRAAADWGFAVLAYCFMPDHLHLLVEAEADDADLMKFAHAVKQRTGYQHRRISPDVLWQQGYFEHVLRDDEMVPVVARYILANPVRAGLCIEPQDYPFAGSLVWSKEQLNDLWNENGTV
jgi:putative transposase